MMQPVELAKVRSQEFSGRRGRIETTGKMGYMGEFWGMVKFYCRFAARSTARRLILT